MSRCIIADKPAPLLNVPDFNEIFGAKELALDPQGLLRAIEMVALAGTKFEVKRAIDPYILEVETRDYPHGCAFIDVRFTRDVGANAPDRRKNIPPKDVILERLYNSVGLPYIWGGNWGKGIPEIPHLYGGDPSPIRLLQGVDCSGLLYEATDGATPRNTSKLMHFGERVDSLLDVKPLDIIVWPGHMIIALDETTSIESALGRGVFIAPLKSRLPESNFVINRFIF